MAIEPLRSMMSTQVQQTQQVQQTAAERSVTKTGTDISGTEAADENTAAAGNVQGEEQKTGQQTQTANEQIKRAVEQLNKKMFNESEAVYGFHEGTNRVMIKIVDKNTKEVIREVPPEKTLDMIVKLWEIAGIMVDEKR